MYCGKLLYSAGGIEGLITTKLTGAEVHLTCNVILFPTFSRVIEFMPVYWREWTCNW